MNSKNKSLKVEESEIFDNFSQKANSYNWDELIPLREKQSDEYVPEIEEIIEYGEYIGLEFPGDESLLYIAKEGITATLPPEWEACQTLSGDMLYRNLVTREITEEHPLDEIYRSKVLEIKKEHARIEQYESEEFSNSDNIYENEENRVLDAIQEEEKEDYSDSYASGRLESQENDIFKNFSSLKNNNSGKLSMRNHLRHEEEFTKRSMTNGKKMIPRLNINMDNLNEENNEDLMENNFSAVFKPYRLKESKELEIKSGKTSEYRNFLADFSEEYTFEKSNHLSKQQSKPEYHASLNIPLPTDFCHDESPEKPVLFNPLHKPSPQNSSNQTLLKIKELNQQLAQYKNEKQLKQTLLDQIKSNNELKIQLLKEKLKNKNKHKKEKIHEKLQKMAIY